MDQLVAMSDWFDGAQNSAPNENKGDSTSQQAKEQEMTDQVSENAEDKNDSQSRECRDTSSVTAHEEEKEKRIGVIDEKGAEKENADQVSGKSSKIKLVNLE